MPRRLPLRRNMSLALEPNETMSAKQEDKYIIEAPPRQCNAVLTTHLSVTDFSPIRLLIRLVLSNTHT